MSMVLRNGLALGLNVNLVSVLLIWLDQLMIEIKKCLREESAVGLMNRIESGMHGERYIKDETLAF